MLLQTPHAKPIFSNHIPLFFRGGFFEEGACINGMVVCSFLFGTPYACEFCNSTGLSGAHALGLWDEWRNAGHVAEFPGI